MATTQTRKIMVSDDFEETTALDGWSGRMAENGIRFVTHKIFQQEAPDLSGFMPGTLATLKAPFAGQWWRSSMTVRQRNGWWEIEKNYTDFWNYGDSYVSNRPRVDNTFAGEDNADSYGKTVELSTTLAETPLQNAELFKCATLTDWKLAQLAFEAETQSEACSYIAQACEAKQDMITTMIRFKLAGISTFLSPVTSLKIRESDVATADLGDVGKRGTPNAGINLPKNMEWLLASSVVSKETSGGESKNSRTQEWLGATVWCHKLYDKA